MNIIITGATSMLGTAIMREYLKNDVDTIYAVIRRNSPHRYRIPKSTKIVIVECDLNEYKRLPELIPDECDVFFHLAWDGTGKTRENSTLGQAKNIVYTLDALAAAKLLGCGKLIGAGSQAEYGLLDIPKINEDCPTKPIIPYGMAKLAAGQMVMTEAKKLDMDCLWVRVFSVYGLYDKSSSMISTAICGMMSGKRVPFTLAVQRWDYLHCDDAARAFFMIAEKCWGQKVICLGSGQSRLLMEYICTMRDIVNPAAELGFGDIPYKGNEVMNLCADISLLTDETGWKPDISFEQGINMLKKQMININTNDLHIKDTRKIRNVKMEQ